MVDGLGGRRALKGSLRNVSNPTEGNYQGEEKRRGFQVDFFPP